MAVTKRALILAAGRGTRLGNLTSNLPKCLIEFHGQSLLSRALSALESAGVTDVRLVTGYKCEQLAAFNLTTYHNRDWESTGIFCSCYCADSWLAKERTLIIYSDIFFAADDIAHIRTMDQDLIVAYESRAIELWKRRFINPLDDLEVFRIADSGKILDIGGSPSGFQDVQGQYTGIISLSPYGWELLKAAAAKLGQSHAKVVDMTTLLRELVKTGVHILGVPLTCSWGEIDYEHDLNVFQSLFRLRDF